MAVLFIRRDRLLTFAGVLAHVEDDRQDNYEALDDLLPVGMHPHQRHPVAHDRKDERADNRAADRSDSAGMARSADRRRRDRGQLVPGRQSWLS